MTKEEMLEEAEYLIETNPNAGQGYYDAQDPKQPFSMTLPECFDLLYSELTNPLNMNSPNSVGWWYGRIVNPNRPKG